MARRDAERTRIVEAPFAQRTVKRLSPEAALTDVLEA